VRVAAGLNMLWETLASQGAKDHMIRTDRVPNQDRRQPALGPPTVPVRRVYGRISNSGQRTLDAT
jgi:hypothetical protein